VRRAGIRFDAREAHERVHVEPLARRLRDAGPPAGAGAAVVVHAASRVPERGAWNVQVFHGLGDKGYTLNPLLLQRGRFPRVRTAANLASGKVGLPARWMRPPADPGRRPGRYQQANAYGPRWADALSSMLKDTVVSRHGHVALNERDDLRPDPKGPVAWLPTWDNRAFLGGGTDPSSLRPFAADVLRLAAGGTPVRVKVHPRTVAHDQAPEERARLAAAPGIAFEPAGGDPYAVLRGARGLLTDSSSLGFEAFCVGFPVALLEPPGTAWSGLHAELHGRVPSFAPGGAGLAAWAAKPPSPGDRTWARDLLDPPSSARNDAFAKDLRERGAA
jgi:hypothetical protein